MPIRQESDWENLTEVLKRYPEVKQVKDRLGWLLAKESLTVVVEFEYIDKDFRDTFSAYFSKRFHTPNNRCSRLHFFRGLLTLKGLLGEKLPKGCEYLGYSVLRPIHTKGLGRTMVSAKLLPDSAPREAHYRTCEEEVNLLGRSFSVRGFPYIAQDQEVFVCVQASLWMLVRYFTNRYRNYREVGPHQLSNLVPKSATRPDGLLHSSVWNDAFLVHDDAGRPYHQLELPGGPNSGERPADDDRSFGAIRAFIAPMPEKTFLSADAYQLQAMNPGLPHTAIRT